MKRSMFGSSAATISILSLTVGVTSALTPSQYRPTFQGPHHSSLSALPNPSSNSWGSRGVPSKTARESAFNVEWEPMTELERRIEDGIHYEHNPGPVNHRQRYHPPTGAEPDDVIPSTRGVFVGYRYTEDEYNRLKSANVCQ